MRSMVMPSRSHQTASLLKLNRPLGEAKGTPLSLRMLEGKPRSLRSLFKYSKSVVFSGGGKRFTGEKKTAGVVGNRQRVAVLVISQQELAFVIGAPQLVGPQLAGTKKDRWKLKFDMGTRGGARQM